MSLVKLYNNKHYESLLGLCLNMSMRLQWQELYLCSLSLIHLDYHREAITLLEQLLEAAPRSTQIQIRLLLYHCFSQLHQWQAADNQIKPLAKVEKFHSVFVRLTSHVSWQIGDKEQAIVQLEEECAQKQKASAPLLNALGYMLVDTETDIERGYEYCHQAVRLVPNYGSYLDSFGWACFKKGEQEKALYLLQQAHLLLPDNTEIEEHLSALTRR